ncbi:MAG TPA: DUF2130 domain-containing protein [Pirellulales bacterium]|nr:DUF2130 domain-containing protein [Pirellulales bacterium]
MTEPTLTCPTCRTQIKLTESLAAPLIEATRKRFEAQLARKEAEVAGREAAIRDQQAQIAAAKESIDAAVAAKVDEERSRIATAEAQKAKRLVAIDLDHKAKEIADLNDVLRQRDAKLAEAQQAQADLIKKQRELDDAKREMDLTIQKQVQAALGAVRDQAKQEAEAALNLRVREKEEQIASMQRQIEDLRRKAEQGSHQLQGEVQELALEALLRQKFPRDVIEPVPKGEFGGDLIQRVVGPAGQVCGSILWEAKRTKSWADGWLGKVREDQRAAKADMALIVSHALPKGLQTFDQIDGVWVTEPRCAVAVAIALRESLIALAAARLAGEGRRTKMELVYQYLTGPRFRHRIEAVVERFSDMQADLDRERKTMMRLLAKREEQIRGVVESTAGLYGDLQGIAGRTLLEIEGLELPLLDGPAGSEAAE